MKDQIKYFKNFISSSNVEEILSYSKKFDNLFLEYGNGEKEFKFQSGDHIIKNDKAVFDALDKIANLVFEKVKLEYPYRFLEISKDQIHIAKFENGPGMHEHFDISRPNDIATILYLNDDYIGGEIYFPEYSISIKPKAGDLVMFPDNEMYVHGVKGVSGGPRYTLPRWFTRIV